MKKVLLLLAKGFEPLEASAFIDVFGWNAIEGDKKTELTTCALTKEVISSFGLKVMVDTIINNIKPNEFDALAIPGGFEEYGFYEDAFDERFLKIIREFDTTGKTIASICTGALSLGKAGVLYDKNATTYRYETTKRLTQLKEMGGKIIDKSIVIDKNIITSCGPYTAVSVAFILLEKLTNKNNSDKIKKLMGF